MASMEKKYGSEEEANIIPLLSIDYAFGFKIYHLDINQHGLYKIIFNTNYNP